MKATDADLREALRAACPPAEALAGAGQRSAETPPVEIADHLAHCSDCAFEYRLASTLKPWAKGTAGTGPKPAKRGAGKNRLVLAALAASVVLSAGLAGLALSLRQESDRLQARMADARTEPVQRSVGGVPPLPPYANVPVVDLFPRDPARGGGDASSFADVSESPYVVLILNVREPVSAATYAVEILDGNGHEIWSADNVHRGEEPLALGVPGSLLSGEAYRIRLHHLRGGRSALAEQYDLRIKREKKNPAP